MKHQATQRYFGLDCMRALAICLVVISHCTFLLFPNTVSLSIRFIRTLGAVGVDLFFVLSGYLIGGLLLNIIKKKEIGWREFLRFWNRRWLRTLPNYFLVLGINVLIAIILNQTLPEKTTLYALFMQNFAWNHPDFFTEAWSLSIEEFAYLILPIFLYVGILFNKNGNREKLFIKLTILTIISLTFLKLFYYLNSDVTSYKFWSSSFRKVVIYRIDSIYIGFIVVYCVKTASCFFRKHKMRLLSLGVFVFGLLHFLIYTFNLLPQTHLWFYIFVYLHGVALSIALTFPFFINLGYNGLGKVVIQFVSTRSYAIYLVNYSMVLLGIKYFINVSLSSGIVKIGLTVLFLSITIAFSNLIYVYFESPIMKYRDRKFPK